MVNTKRGYGGCNNGGGVGVGACIGRGGADGISGRLSG